MIEPQRAPRIIRNPDPSNAPTPARQAHISTPGPSIRAVELSAVRILRIGSMLEQHMMTPFVKLPEEGRASSGIPVRSGQGFVTPLEHLATGVHNLFCAPETAP